MTKSQAITVAYGDGIGPEIMQATLDILEAAGANLSIEKVKMGEALFLAGHPTGISDEVWHSLRHTHVFLKAPMTTPQGGGYRSLNVTLRTKLGLYANVRPASSYFPAVATKHPKMDLIIVRENEEDLYAGIEYRQSDECATAVKLISEAGSARIIRFAFELARQHNRKKVTAMSKDNILKFTDGLFHTLFDEIGALYPDIEKEFYIIDIGSAKIADSPELFDVVVLPNLYGDILSDVANQITGSVGLGGSGNYGKLSAMFEAVHGAAPRLAGKDMANPSGLLLAAIMMLLHLHQPAIATLIHNSWLRTLEEGIMTYDLYQEAIHRQKVGTKAFAKAVIERLGQRPTSLKEVDYQLPPHAAAPELPLAKSSRRELVGVDVTLHSHDSLEKLVQKIERAQTPSLKLCEVANRGAKVWGSKVWLEATEETLCIAEWRCRFFGQSLISHQAIAALLHRLADLGLEVLNVQNLYHLNGKKGFADL